jgi:hypothetical protein
MAVVTSLSCESATIELSRFGAQAIFVSTGDKDTRLHPGSIEEQERVLKTLNGIGVGWARWMGTFDVMRVFVDQDQGYNFKNTDLFAEAAYRNGIALIGHLSTSHEPGLPGFGPLNDREAFKNYVRATAERYDGDADFGLPENHPAYPNCDLNGDGKVTDEEELEWGRTHRFHVWQTMKEPGVPFAGHLTELNEVMDILKASWEAIREVDPKSPILFATTPPGPADGIDNMKQYFTEILKAGGGKYFDVAGVDCYIHPAEEVLGAHREALRAFGLDKPIWVVQYGAPAVESPGRLIPNGGSLEKQAIWVVKGAVLSFAAGAEKVFYGDFLYLVDEAEDFMHDVGLLNMDGVRTRPGFYTYGLTISKLDRFSSVRKVAEGQYRFEFPNKKPVYVLWEEEGENGVADLSEQVGTKEVLVTHIIAKVGQTSPQTERVPANAVPVGKKPIFVEAAGK